MCSNRLRNLSPWTWPAARKPSLSLLFRGRMLLDFQIDNVAIALLPGLCAQLDGGKGGGGEREQKANTHTRREGDGGRWTFESRGRKEKKTAF